jgi:hypothetical protein
MEKTKHDVYEIVINGSKHLFSDGVKRDFGENKVVFVDGHQILASVQPLHTTDGLKCIGHLYA